MFVSLLTCMGRDDADTVMTGFQWFSSTRPFSCSCCSEVTSVPRSCLMFLFGPNLRI